MQKRFFPRYAQRWVATMKNENFSISSKRRGISNLIGSLVILGIVSAVGSVVLFHGLGEISAFSYDMKSYDNSKNQALLEDIVFEHVRFPPASDDIVIHLGNVGNSESQIVSVMVLKLDTQELIVDWKPVDSYILIKDNAEITINDVTLGGSTWDDPYYLNSEYRISVTTSKDNFFATIAQPYNT